MNNDIEHPKMWISGYSNLLKKAVKQDIYILTAFGFYIGITRRDLKYSIGKRRYKFFIEITNAIFISNMKRI
jgi:hypothetical protein